MHHNCQLHGIPFRRPVGQEAPRRRQSAGPRCVRPAVGCLRRSRPGTMRAVLVYGCFAVSGPAGARHRVVFGAPGCADACWLNGLDRPCSAARARASAGSAAAVDSGPSGGAPHAGHFSRLLACAACWPSACWKASSTAAGRNSVPAPSGGTSQRRCPAARSGGGDREPRARAEIADFRADLAADRVGWQEETHPACDEVREGRAGSLRNAEESIKGH